MIIVLTGPTCTSKSKIAIELAKFFNGEIVNADAFQVYKELNIGTAKPSEDDLKKVKHHLYDFINPNVNYSIYNYQKDARECISELIKKNKNIILVGGSGLYIKSVIYDFCFSEKKDVNLEKFEKMSNEELHSELEKIDIETAKKIHFNNRRRVLRAITIFLENNNTPKSVLEKRQNHNLFYKNIYLFSTKIENEQKDFFNKKIRERIKKMIDTGLFKEALSLYEKYGKVPSLKAIGYKEVIDNPTLKDEEILDLIQKNTFKYAKKQMTFIKHQYINADVHFIKNAEEIIDFINQDIFSRTKGLIGEKVFENIRKIKIGVFGIGGVGGTALESLVRSGVNNLYIFDHDTVNASNLNRQILFDKNDIGKKKVKAAEEKLKRINSNVKIECFDFVFNDENKNKIPFDDFDYVIDAIDDIKNKSILIEILLKKKIPFISSLAAGKKINPSLVSISTLDKVNGDPIGDKIKFFLKNKNIDFSNINVVFSSEKAKKSFDINSLIFVPSTIGIFLAYFILNSEIKKCK